MSQPFLAEIRIFTGNFAPRGWLFCHGQLVSIAQNTALFSLVGTTYGGNGQTTFGIPDLRGRTPIGAGNGPALSPRVLGEMSGVETVTLNSTQIPQHTHALNASASAPTTNTPSGNVLPTGSSRIYAQGSPSAQLSPSSIGLAGGSQAHENMQPYLAINYIIATQGIYPSRN